jgi:hypothetical protein
MEFAGGMTAAFTLTGFSATHGRICRIQGSKGELFFDEAASSIKIKRFDESGIEEIPILKSKSYHPEDKEIVGN